MIRRSLMAFLFLLLAAGCSGDHSGGEGDPFGGSPLALRQKMCPTAESASRFSSLGYLGDSGGKSSSFAEIRSTLLSSCQQCHQFPAGKGGFSFRMPFTGAKQ